MISHKERKRKSNSESHLNMSCYSKAIFFFFNKCTALIITEICQIFNFFLHWNQKSSTVCCLALDICRLLQSGMWWKKMKQVSTRHIHVSVVSTALSLADKVLLWKKTLPAGPSSWRASFCDSFSLVTDKCWDFLIKRENERYGERERASKEHHLSRSVGGSVKGQSCSKSWACYSTRRTLPSPAWLGDSFK